MPNSNKQMIRKKQTKKQQQQKTQTVTLNEPPRDKTNNVVVRPAKTQISLGNRPV